MVSITTTRAADTCVRQLSTIVFRYETCVFYSAAPPCTKKGRRQSAVECGEEGREKRGLGSSVLLNIKGTKQNGKNPERMEIRKVYRSKCGEIFLISCDR